ncbi:MAG: DnaD domain protein [Oscillospiraceae bacterium]
MEDKFSKPDTPCSLPAEDADRLIRLADGSCALLYLYLLRNGAGHSRRDVASALAMAEGEVERAVEKLRSAGLLAAPARRLPPPENELPEYTAEDVVRRSAGDGAFTCVISETENIMGRSISGADMKTLFGIYDSLGLPPEVILLLLHHCVEEYREKYGPGRVPPMRWIEKEAYVWANRELMTLDAAEDYLRAKREREGYMLSLRLALGIRDRELIPTERKYIDGWLELGFSAEAIELAYDRTIIGTGQLKWQYMNKIIMSWHAKGLHTPAEIQKGDGPKRSSPAKGGGDDGEQLKSAYEKLKNGSR